MGTIFSRILPQRQQAFGQNLDQSQNQINKEQKPSAIELWHNSSKSLPELIKLIESEQSAEEKYKSALSFVSMLTNREKIREFLWGLEKYLLGEETNRWDVLINELKKQEENNNCKCTLENSDKSFLFQEIHSRYSNIWFINQKNLKTMTPHIHEKQLQQLHLNHNFSEKLCQLYLCSIFNHLENQQLFKTQIKSALLTNYPLLITPETLGSFVRTLVEEEIYLIQDQIYFTRFVSQLMRWGQLLTNGKNCKALQEYAEKTIAMMDGQEYFNSEMMIEGLKKIEQLKRRYEDNWVIHCLIEQSKYFLKVGNPHSMELTYKCAINLPFHKFTEEQLNLYLYTRVYSTFLYEIDTFLCLDFFQDLYTMQIRDIIYHLLKGNEVNKLETLKSIFSEVEDLGGKSQAHNFSIQLQNYIFSKYCTLRLCLQILNTTNYIQIKKNEHDCQSKIVGKIKQCQFQILLQNIESAKAIISSISSDNTINLQNFSKICDIVNLLYILGINDKVNDVWIFFQQDPSSQNYHSHKKYLQEKALFFLKSLISKYFINANANKTKTISLNNRDRNPVMLELSNPEALFEICLYLYNKIFGKVIPRIADMHQIIFQHMLYFYKYEQLKSLTSSSSFLTKYSIEYQTLQILIIENIHKQLLHTEYRKIYKDIAIQLKLLKHSTIEKQSVVSFHNIIKYLSNDFSIELEQKLKEKMNISLLYSLVELYPEKIEVINFDNIYEDLRKIHETEIQSDVSIFDPNSQAYLMTNQLLVFKSILAIKAYQLNKRKFANQLIEEINRFHPPWITSKLIEIFKKSENKSNSPIDDRLFGVAVNGCVRGQDLEYLLRVWRKGNVWKKENKFKFGAYFETGREYLILDDEIINDEEQYRNFVAETKFSDETLAHRNYQLFYILLGTDPMRAFHHALITKLDIIKLQIIFKQAMKQNIMNPFSIAKYFYRLVYFLQKNSYISFKNFKAESFDLKKLKEYAAPPELTSELAFIYPKIYASYKLSLLLSPAFIDKYFSESTKVNIAYQLIFNPTNGKNQVMKLIEEPMGKADIDLFNEICVEGYNVTNLLQLCMFRLSNKANSSEQIGLQMQNILHKMLVLSKQAETTHKLLKKFCEKIFSVKMLVKILDFLRNSYNIHFNSFITERHLQILQSLANVEQNQEFSGLIPVYYFQRPIGFSQIQKQQQTMVLSEKHKKIIEKARRKTNIFVISKVVSFFYGINKQIENSILRSFMESNAADEEIRALWEDLKEQDKLSRMSK